MADDFPESELPLDADGDSDTAVAELDAPAQRLNQNVEVIDIGPCKKHIKVTIERADIDARLDEKYSELVLKHQADIPGFRKGKAPRRLVERHYGKGVRQEVRGEVLMASLEQLAEEQDIAPLAPPNLNPAQIEIPEYGPLFYEFEVEVRPQFELPDYKGLKLRRPVYDFTDDDIVKEERKLLEPHGQLVPKEGDGAAVEEGDMVVCDLVTRHGDRVLNDVKEVRIRVEPRLAMKDGVAPRFLEQLAGAKAGESRVVDITLAESVSDQSLSGQSVQATFQIKDIKTFRLPELTHELCHQFGVHNEDQLKELIRVSLERRLEYQQRQAAREQIIGLVADKALSELPQDLLVRQARRAMSRRVAEMRTGGISEDEIAARQRLLQQDIIRTTALSLKEHFVLQKIAEVEKIDVSEDDITDEIERIADRSNESSRKVRARLEKDEMLDSLAAEILEAKALDLILDHAEYEDVPLRPGEGDTPVSSAEAQAVPGELREPAPEEASAPVESAAPAAPLTY